MTAIRRIRRTPTYSKEALIMGADQLARIENEMRLGNALRHKQHQKMVKEVRNEGLVWSKDRTLRRVASIPGAINEAMINAWGINWVKDNTAWSAFINSPEGQACLTVDPTTV